jgi:hypothetical protein
MVNHEITQYQKFYNLVLNVKHLKIVGWECCVHINTTRTKWSSKAKSCLLFLGYDFTIEGHRCFQPKPNKGCKYNKMTHAQIFCITPTLKYS